MINDKLTAKNAKIWTGEAIKILSVFPWLIYSFYHRTLSSQKKIMKWMGTFCENFNAVISLNKCREVPVGVQC